MMQTSVLRPIEAEGVALHAGGMTRLALRPAPAGAGISFRRVDLGGDNVVKAHPRNVVDARLGVRIRNAAGAEAMTIEHLMAAALLCGLDNALVDIDRAELPIFDGSLARYVALIEAAGLAPLSAARRTLTLNAPIRVESGDRFVEIFPDARRRIEMSIDFPAAAIGRQDFAFDLDDAAVKRRIISARTFCTLAEVGAMRAAGFSLGGSLDNAVVVDDDRILNDEPLRDTLEFVLHKAADLIGDLSLVGAPVLGLVRAHKPGHDLNTKLARRIVEAALPVEMAHFAPI